MSRRPVVFLAPEEQEPQFRRMLEEGHGLSVITVDEARRRIPALKPDYAVAAAIEPDAFDIDVASLHQGFLRQLRARGGQLSLERRAERIERPNGVWDVQVTGGAVLSAPVVVNAAGAWGDDVAAKASVAGLGLAPKRRTGVIVGAGAWQPENWPMINDVGHTWYARPEARTKLMVSPADETDMPPHDVQPDELDIAIAIDRMQRALDVEVRRVEHSWAGLRTFTPDRSLAFGWDAAAPGFFWAVGQGGYGIQTSPAAGCLVADLIAGRDPGAASAILPQVDPRRFKK
jgi:D-arginine dehydrogenase